MSQKVTSSPPSTFHYARPIAAKPALGPGACPSSRSPTTSSTYNMASRGAISNGSGASAGATTTSNSTMEEWTGRPHFNFQFSAATEMILKRLRGEGGPLNPSAALGVPSGTAPGMVQPPGYEDVRRSVLQGMKTTLNMDIPINTSSTAKKGAKAATSKTPAAAANAEASTSTDGNGVVAPKAKATPKLGRARAGTKRKKAKDDSDSDEESSPMSGLGDDSESEGTTNMPKQTLSGRKVVKPTQFNPATLRPARKRSNNHKRTGRSVDQALCKRCGRGNSPLSNMIVFCDGCNTGWHQMCHDPVVSNELVKDESKEWFCKNCAPKRLAIPSPVSDGGKETSWSGKTTEEKRAYLSTFPQSHLVSLLLHATAMHADIPIFSPSIPSPQPHQQNMTKALERRLYVYPQQPFPPSATSTAGLFARAEANPNAPINFIRKIPAGGSASPSSPFTTSFDHNPMPDSAPHATVEQFSSAPPNLPPSQPSQFGQDEDAEGEDESRESTPASPPYPKPGNGLMAKLTPDDQDLEWLVGEGDSNSAFSHVVFDTHGEAHNVDERTIGMAGAR